MDNTSIKTPMRATMIRPMIGQVKTSSTLLPSDDFVYGIATTPDDEGAGKVIQRWAQSEPSKPHESMRSFPATNREALKNGCFTARAQRDFAKHNFVFKSNPKSIQRRQQVDEDALAEEWRHCTFGIRSEPNDAPIEELLRCSQSDAEETYYPDRSHRHVKGRLPVPKSTKSSQLLENHIKIVHGEHSDEELFKMARFQKVESKIKLRVQ